ICFLFFKINLELEKDRYISLYFLLKKHSDIFNNLKSYSSVGWFNLEKYIDYKKEEDYKYITFQYLIAPTLLNNYGYNRKIICYYQSPKDLIGFCKKNKKYRLICINIFNNFAFLEKVD
ncbi:MAG: hypothetical protein II567_06880, partial [Candidatus Riflebacteria bacterium]|nr:hypothetical protein [Candidatus Riflebacteria bacterium]